MGRVGRGVAAAAAIVVAVSVDATAAAAAQVVEPLGPVVVIAHRGASYDAPEHTLPAYHRAVEVGTDFLECDLQLTKDQVLVCVHDTTVDRTSDGTGRVDAFTLDELRQLDFGTWFNEATPARARPEYAGTRIVTLEEQLACYRAYAPTMRFHLETKAPAEYGGRMEPLLVDLLRRHGLLDTGDAQTSTIVIQSFELDSLVAVKALAPTLPTAWLWQVPPPEAFTGDIPDSVDIVAPYTLHVQADLTLVPRLHAAGKPVHVWTVDDPLEMDRLLALGVDGIFSNRPDVLRARVDAAGVGVPAAQRANPSSLPTGCPVMNTAAAPASALPPASSVGAADDRRLPATGPPALADAGWALLLAAALLRRVLYSQG
jgi:glycerophosphoryl diester phosphodiesterase